MALPPAVLVEGLTSVGEEGGSRGDSLKLGSVGLPNTAPSLVDSALVTVEIKGLNEAPVALDDSVTITEDGSVGVAGTQSLNVLDNDTDDNGDLLMVTAIAGGVVGSSFMVTTANGVETSVTVAANGEVTFDHGECTGSTPGRLLRHGRG